MSDNQVTVRSKDDPVAESLSESSDIVSGERTGNFRPVDQFISDMHKQVNSAHLTPNYVIMSAEGRSCNATSDQKRYRAFHGGFSVSG